MKDTDDELQLVFRAISHPIRRTVLDMLREEAGLSLSQLVTGCDVTRQSFTQHLQVLEEADLVRCEFVGRERRHYLNLVPLFAITDEWLSRFVNPQVRALLGLQDRVAGDVARRGKKRA